MTVGNINSVQQSFENLKKIAQKREQPIKQATFPTIQRNEAVTFSSAKPQSATAVSPKETVRQDEAKTQEATNENKFGVYEQYVKEVKNFFGNEKLKEVEDEDIKYALRYGTSILADYKA